MTRWTALIGSIVAEVTATLSLRGALETLWLYAIVVTGYLAAFYLLSRALRAGMPIGAAYGIWGASGVALTAVFSTVFFDEPLTGMMTLGLALIISGVLVIEFGSQTAARNRASTENGS
ncbi:QacE family quaternary ammonium compound efflux SMR transporter [Brevibacterium sp. RIT803]|nr:QacE family quaternary ammonium compound efflux SMR transporter [Brevibacterium sp. RIT 803]